MIKATDDGVVNAGHPGAPDGQLGSGDLGLQDQAGTQTEGGIPQSTPDGKTGDGKKYKWVCMIQTTSHFENGSRTLNKGIRSLFDPCVNAMGWPPC